MGTYAGPMDHASVLNMLLSHACPVDMPDGDSITVRFDLHCQAFEIDARLNQVLDEIQFEVVAVRNAV